jgi:hypothetical protein
VAGPQAACVLEDGEGSSDLDDEGHDGEEVEAGDGAGDDEGGEAIGESQHEVIAGNGMSLNGMSLNGMSLNGMSLNGMSLNGSSLTGVTIQGSQLAAKNPGGQTLTGAALVGAQLDGQLSSGGTLKLRIDSAQTLTGANADVWAYGVSYRSGSSWVPLCGVSGGAPVLAIPLAGTWNYRSNVSGGGSWTGSATSFTLGCRGAVLAKCVELGYKPWKTVGGALLRNHHQACTRALRADYCGNGKSYTVDGTPINIYDGVGIQGDATTWPVDAEWTPGGARCIHHARSWASKQGIPLCLVLKLLGPCGSFKKGALIVNEYKKQ